MTKQQNSMSTKIAWGFSNSLLEQIDKASNSINKILFLLIIISFLGIFIYKYFNIVEFLYNNYRYVLGLMIIIFIAVPLFIICVKYSANIMLLRAYISVLNSQKEFPLFCLSKYSNDPMLLNYYLSMDMIIMMDIGLFSAVSCGYGLCFVIEYIFKIRM